MVYLQLTHGERYVIGRMRASMKSLREIARCLGRAVSTISREVQRNRCPHDGWYRSEKAHSRAVARRSRTRKKSQYSEQEWAGMEALLARKWSPQQISGRRRLCQVPGRSATRRSTDACGATGAAGGQLWRHLRVMSKVGRKKRGSPATRGRLLGKRHISQRPSLGSGKDT